MKEIDEKINSILVELHEHANSLEFQEFCEFTLATVKTIPFENLNYQGLYLIEIRNDNKHQQFINWANDFCLRWTDPIYVKRWVSNPKKIRLSKHKELNEWIPLYIGKSKKIKDRILEHIYLQLHQPTTGLKLMVRQNMQQEVFKISYMNIPTSNYDWIMPKLEKIFRDRINPIIGRQ